MSDPTDIAARVIADLSFDRDGLVPAIAQSDETGEVLMLAYMNADAVRETLESGQVCYWSRSRARLWRKGESSGHVQQLVELRYDCDNDALLLRVRQTGPACHTNRPNCFYNAVRDGVVTVISEPQAE
jgi:phosphoribosyl-AMP cyclohydrolase